MKLHHSIDMGVAYDAIPWQHMTSEQKAYVHRLLVDPTERQIMCEQAVRAQLYEDLTHRDQTETETEEPAAYHDRIMRLVGATFRSIFE